MVLRMKNFIILGVCCKIWLLWGASWKTNVEGGLPKKGAWTVCWFKVALARKRKRGCFSGGMIPQCTLCIFSKLWLIFCWHQQKLQKMSHFWHFNDHNCRSKHNKTNVPFFHLLFELYLFVYFIFAFQDLQNSVAWVSLLGIIFWSVKYTLICERWPFQGC